MGYSPPKCGAMFQNKYTFRKCMILLECLTHSLVPESSPTPSHSPKPRMRILIFICLLVDNPPMCRYQFGRLRRLILFMDYPPIYQLGRLRRLIFLVLDNPQIIHVLDNPSEPFSLYSSHALTPIVLGCPVHMECMYANSNTV